MPDPIGAGIYDWSVAWFIFGRSSWGTGASIGELTSLQPRDPPAATRLAPKSSLPTLDDLMHVR
jgi:hypothetical protein